MTPQLRVGYQGEAGAFSESAARAFRPDSVTVPRRSFLDVVRAVDSGADDAGVLPVENTLAGGVAPAFDALLEGAAEGRVSAIEEVILPIRHYLLGVPGAPLGSLREVRSHPVALAQCQRFLQAHPAITPVAVHDTAGAAREVAELGDPAVAAIAPWGAAERYGLHILQEDLQDRGDNQTRFLLIVRSPPPGGGAGPETRDDPGIGTQTETPAPAPPGGALKTALIVETLNRPGALRDLLSIFADRGQDLTFIESRPCGTPWAYRFVLEFRHETPEDARASLETVRAGSRQLRILGTYRAHPAGLVREGEELPSLDAGTAPR